MPEEPEEGSLEKGVEASKVLARVVIVLYVVGFLVVTFHLAQFGFVPVTWLRPQYLLAGIWCLLPALLLLWIVGYGTGQSLALFRGGPNPAPSSTRKHHSLAPPSTSKYRHVVPTLLSLAAFFTATYMVIKFIEFLMGQPLTFKFWGPQTLAALKLAAYCLLTVVGVITVVVTVPKALRARREFSTTYAAECSQAAILLCLTLAAGVAYIRYFSTTVYPIIPSAIGGGRPQAVFFLLEKDEDGEPPVTADHSGSRSIPYKLLLKTDSTYVVQSQKAGEMAIEFRQESVKGMVTLEH